MTRAEAERLIQEGLEVHGVELRATGRSLPAPHSVAGRVAERAAD